MSFHGRDRHAAHRMSCRQCRGIEEMFDQRTVAKELARYRRRGVGGTTRLLIDAVKAAGVGGSTLLDIGGGVGAIQQELLSAGAQSATGVDASAAYLEAQREEAQRRGHGGRSQHYHGDFVTLAPEIPPADVVTLDRVICCYHDMTALVGASVARARRLYGLVYPRYTWWNRIGRPVGNLFLRLRRSSFRIYLHVPGEVETIIRAAGLRRRFARHTVFWQVAVYGR